MKSFLPSRPGRLFALLGLFVFATVSGWSESRVWVQYAPGAKGAVISALKGANGRVHYEFDNINAVAVSLPEQAVAGLSRNPQVVLVEEDPIRELLAESVPYGITKVQATAVWDTDGNGTVDSGASAGQGVTVGVVDSGVYAAHADFAGVTIAGESGTPTAWNVDGLGHGTHVTGTIAAANNSIGVVGVAPKIAKIYMVKVFGDDGAWAYSSTLLYAVQRAVNPGGAKIVSMSLGGTFKSQTEQKGLDAIYKNGNGVLLVAAAGNDGNTRTSYPAGYSSVISVAAIDSSNVVADFSQKNSTVELSAPGVAVLSTVPFVETNTILAGGVTYSGGHIEFSGRGSVTKEMVNGQLATSTNSSWAGKVVLVQRGTNSFAEKVLNVQNSGGLACVIYNNVAGDFLGTMATSSASIPAISVSQEAGNALLSSVNSIVTVTSTSVQPASGYEAWDGTSMATPHVSGVAALIMSAVPGATAGQVREAMDMTALDLGAVGRDTSYGYGLVQAKAAIEYLNGAPPPPPPPGGDDIDPIISNVSVAPAKGKAGTFQISFGTDEPCTATARVDDLTTGSYFGTATWSSFGQSFSVKVQGTVNHSYQITINASDQAGNPATPVVEIYNN